MPATTTSYRPSSRPISHHMDMNDFDGGVPTGRFSNGRLVTDFLSEACGLKSSVPAYLDTSYTIDQFASGVTFASGGTGLDDFTAQIPHVQHSKACGTGLIETSALCGIDQAFTCQDANRYAFFDSVHPSEEIYKMVANEIFDTSLQVFL
ncbi:hypothetical protein EJB05_44434 [Eragrostis curvula]|uniref:GDSL esterase/lipase n=1 Tax=Eragrostis curvula TaxID=38414 RepID=A0A5J9THM9_9POAL|nr:hypothetical protein EJB05_44434 [Eragrostis curvula]